jgi:large subunit ribosomal protein L17
MRHRKVGRYLNRNANHRRATMQNLACNLIEHERIITTVPKAKELRRFVEPLVTIAKSGGLHAHRLILSRLRNNKTAAQKLMTTFGPRFKERPGGYTRIIKRTQYRLGDAAPTCFIEFLAEGETKKQDEAAPTPVAVN